MQKNIFIYLEVKELKTKVIFSWKEERYKNKLIKSFFIL